MESLSSSAVVGCARLLEAVADIVHVLEKLDEFVVDAAGTLGDRLGVAVAVLDLPHIRGGAQRHHQGRRRRDRDMLFRGIAGEARIVLQGDRERPSTGTNITT